MSLFTTYQNSVSISCDCCGETFVDRKGLYFVADGEEGKSAFEDKEDAEDVAERNGWIREGEKHTCTDCLEERRGMKEIAWVILIAFAAVVVSAFGWLLVLKFIGLVIGGLLFGFILVWALLVVGGDI